ncbi:MAG: hypothetical protein MUD10_02220 [Candidatus Pacebacteria bacterium]|jgi:hypothetical protein|nr:hypothetical protein [Candidatus Paceibacterota bacterium]
MINLNYQQISQELTSQLPAKQREVIDRRFGLKTGDRETLEAIGKSHNICRERVRQIEKASLSKMKKKSTGLKDVAKQFARHLKNFGGVREEETLLEELGGREFKSHAFFLLTLSGEFLRAGDSEDFNCLWALDKESLEAAKKFIEAAQASLKEKKQLASSRELAAISGLKKSIAESYLGVSRKIQKNKDGIYGLREWPEVNPKGIKDKIYLLLKKNNKPLHFTDVARKIDGSLVQTVHNELIRDKRFVLIGRGIYALREWGYSEGDVKDVISKIFENENRPLTKAEIMDRVMKQRIIKENTVLMNLSNKKYFSRDSEGKYLRAEGADPRLKGANVQEA